MRVHRTSMLVVLVAAASVAGGSLAHAAEKAAADAPPAHSGPTYKQGGYFMGGFATGDWAKIAGFGLGLDGTNLVRLKPGKPLGIRSSLGLIYNFSRTVDVPGSNLGPNSALSLTTKNTSLLFGIGPELVKAEGDVKPFIFGTVGFNTYWTSSNMSGTAGGSPYSARFGDSRIAFAWSAGLGVRRPNVWGETAELSLEYRSGGGHMYVLPDEVTNTGTTVNVDRKSRNTDQIILRLGTVLGL